MINKTNSIENHVNSVNPVMNNDWTKHSQKKKKNFGNYANKSLQ